MQAALVVAHRASVTNLTTESIGFSCVASPLPVYEPAPDCCWWEGHARARACPRRSAGVP